MLLSSSCVEGFLPKLTALLGSGRKLGSGVYLEETRIGGVPLESILEL
jgi:hypothetical protein